MKTNKELKEEFIKFLSNHQSIILSDREEREICNFFIAARSALLTEIAGEVEKQD